MSSKNCVKTNLATYLPVASVTGERRAGRIGAQPMRPVFSIGTSMPLDGFLR